MKQIQWHHLQAIPYELIDIHLKIKTDLSPESIVNKMIKSGRGGLCYEHNILLMHVLRALGFNVTPLAARNRWQKPIDIITSPGHMVLNVKIDGTMWMCDAGYSSFGAAIPLEIQTDREQTSPLEMRRVIKTDHNYIHQMQVLGKWHDMYTFTLEESQPMDWEIGCYYFTTHPKSMGMNNLVVSIATPTCRYKLNNKELATRFPDGSSEVREITTEKEYIEVLRTIFKLTLPEGFTICPLHTTW